MKTRTRRPVAAAHPGATFALASCVLAATSCTSILGLDVTYDDAAAGGAPATSSASNGGTSTASTSSSGSGTASSGSTGTGGDGGTGGGAGGATSSGSAGGLGGGGDGPGGGGGCPATDPRSDEFDASLDGRWTELDGAPGLLPAGYEVDGGSLRFGSEGGQSQWYANGPGGPFVYQTVEGEFVAWTRVSITRDGAAPPTQTFHGGGLLLRRPLDPPGTTESFIMASVGVGMNPSECRINASVAQNGASPPLPFDVAGSDNCSADLAICRMGGATHVFTREGSGETWEEVDISHASNPDDLFIDPLQLGPAVFAFQGDEDAIGEFQHVRFVPICDRSCEEVLASIQAE